MRLSQYPLFILVFVTCCVTLLWIGERDFASRGEAREALAAQSVLDGNWVLPRGYGGVIASKPPLLQWTAAAASSIRGSLSEFTARLPSGLASLIFVVVFFSFLRARVGQRLAFLSGLLLLESVEWFRLGIECRVDMLHSVFVAGSLLALFRWFEKDLRGFPLLCVLSTVGAILSKGPVGLALPSIVLFVYGFYRGIKPRFLIKRFVLLVLPAAAAGAMWYAAAYFEGGPEFLQKFYYENVARMTSTMEDTPHRHSVFYLFGALMVGTLPWLLLLIPDFIVWPVWPAVRHVYNSFISVKQSFRWLRLRLRIKRRVSVIWGRFYEWLSGRTSFEAFSIITVFVIFVFYSIPSGKRGAYLLPAYPFIAFLAATYFLYMGLLHRRRATLAFAWLCRTIVVVYGIFIFLLLRIHHQPLTWIAKRSAARLDYVLDQLTIASSGSALSLIVLLIPFLIALRHSGMISGRRTQSYLTGLAVLTFSGFLAFHAVVAPQFAASLSPRAFAAQMRPILSDRGLYSFGNEFYSLSFYLHKKMTTLSDGFQEGMQVVLYEKRLDDFKSRLRYQALQPKVLLRSSHAIVEPLENVVLVQLVRS